MQRLAADVNQLKKELALLQEKKDSPIPVLLAHSCLHSAVPIDPVCQIVVESRIVIHEARLTRCFLVDTRASHRFYELTIDAFTQDVKVANRDLQFLQEKAQAAAEAEVR